MSDRPRDLTSERVDRLSTAVADLMEGQAANNRMLLNYLRTEFERLNARFDTSDAKHDKMLASIGNIERDVAEIRRMVWAMQRP